jgi:excisionase family DNA binding protein
MTTTQLYLTRRQAAEYTGLSVKTLDRARWANELRSVGGGDGRAVRFLPEWLDEWLQNRGASPDDDV